VLALQPANDDAHRLIAGIHVERGEWDQAVAEVDRAIAIRPNFWRNHAELGFVHYSAGRLDEAANAYERVTELQPDSARGYHMLGTVQQSAGHLDAALVSYEHANRIRPAASTYANLGTIHFWRGEYAEAATAYEQAIAMRPHEPDLHANLGDALLKLGRRDEAGRAFQRAVDEVTRLLAVNDKDALNLALLSMYRAKLGEAGAADEAMARARALSPREGEIAFIGAMVHALNGRAGDACRLLDEAVALGAIAELIRRSDELRTLQGCPVYDRLIGTSR
jgi:eukaryotic-like serine/threonine-protein kinase